MLYLTCTTITSIDLAHYELSRAKDWVSVKCGTSFIDVDRCSYSIIFNHAKMGSGEKNRIIAQCSLRYPL